MMRFLSMIGFMKIIRVAKMVETSQRFSNSKSKIKHTMKELKIEFELVAENVEKTKPETRFTKRSQILDLDHKQIYQPELADSDDESLDYSPSVSSDEEDELHDKEKVDAYTNLVKLMQRRTSGVANTSFLRNFIQNQNRKKARASRDSVEIAKHKLRKLHSMVKNLDKKETKVDLYYDNIGIEYEEMTREQEIKEIKQLTKDNRNREFFKRLLTKENRKLNLHNKKKNELVIKSESKLEKRLTANILKIVIGVCMSIIILFPLTESIFIIDITYDNSKILDLDEICSKNIAKELQNYNDGKDFSLFIFNWYISNCLDPIDEGLDNVLAHNMIRIDFSNCLYFTNLAKDPLYMGQIVPTEKTNELENALNNFRFNIDYFKNTFLLDDNCSFSYLINNRPQSFFFSLLFVMQTAIVSVLLLYSVFSLMKFQTEYVIKPLDKLFSAFYTYFTSTDKFNVKQIIKFEKETEFELMMITKYTKAIFNIISCTIGREILSVIPFTNLTENLAIDTCQKGVLSEVCFVKMTVVNLDSITKRYGVHTIVLMNKLYSLFHKLGLIYDGSNGLQPDVLIWHFRNNLFMKRHETYVVNLVSEQKKEEKEVLTAAEIDEDNKRKSILLGLAFILRFMYNLHAFHVEILDELKEAGASINLYLGKANIVNGYLGGRSKLHEIQVGKDFKETLKLAVFN